MKIDLLDDNTYALYDGDTQVKQAPITQEMRDEARIKKWTGSESQVRRLKAVIGRIEAVIVESPISTAVEVDGQTVIVVPAHEHPIDDRYAEAEHDHAYSALDHDHGTHSHDEFLLIRTAIEEESRTRYKADQEQEGRYKVHAHPELAPAFHQHADVYASLNVINERITTVEASIPKDVQAHVHNDVIEAINLLRAEMHGLRGEVSSLGHRLDAEDRALLSLLDARVSELQPKGDYATREELPIANGLPNIIRLKKKSSQGVDGAEVTTFEVLK